MQDSTDFKDHAMRQSDHDLLVSIHTKVERVIDDVKDLGMNVGGRLTLVEETKLGKKEYDVEHADHEKRIRNLERYVWLAIGALAVLQFILKFVNLNK